MSGATINLSLNLPDFNITPWHKKVNDNFSIIDSIIYTMFGITNVKGLYQNSTQVYSGERYVDDVTGQIYEVIVSHVTSASPATFAEDRITNSSNWLLLDASAALNGLTQTLQARSDALAAAAAAETTADEIQAILDGIVLDPEQFYGGDATVLLDWDDATSHKNAPVYADAAASLLPSGFEYGVSGSPGRAAVGFYHAVDDDNGALRVIALESGNRWDRRYEGGIWQAWSRVPNRNEVVRRDFILTGNIHSAVDSASIFGADVYKVDTGSSNLPSFGVVDDYFIAFTKDNNNGSIFYVGKAGQIAHKSKSGGVWGNWVEPGPKLGPANANDIPINFPAGTTFVKVPSGGSNYSGTAAAGDVVIANVIDTNNCNLLVIANSGYIAFKNKTAGTWGSWRYLSGIITSIAQGITLNTVLTVAHGLGSKIDGINISLQCTTAELGYAIGDKVSVGSQYITVAYDNTNLYFVVASAVQILNKTTHALGNITAANWTIVGDIKAKSL